MTSKIETASSPASGAHGLRMMLVAVAWPAAITIATEIVLLRLAAGAPARVATHWGSFSGPPDGFGSPYTYAILMGAVAAVLITALGGGSVLLAHRGVVTRVIKLIGVASVWITLFLGIGLIGALAQQRTASQVAVTPGPGLWLLIGLVVAAGAWFVMPKAGSAPSNAPSTPVSPVVLGTDERAAWHRTATASRGITWLLISLTVLIGVAELVVILVSDGRAWFVAFVPVVLMLVVFATLTWSVRIDAHGVRLRSAIGVPFFVIPLGDIVSAGVIEVRALSEFGGWGVRWNLAGRMGIILRSGQALEIHRHKGVDMVVTIDDATTAAALINGLVQREAARA